MAERDISDLQLTTRVADALGIYKVGSICFVRYHQSDHVFRIYAGTKHRMAELVRYPSANIEYRTADAFSALLFRTRWKNATQEVVLSHELINIDDWRWPHTFGLGMVRPLLPNAAIRGTMHREPLEVRNRMVQAIYRIKHFLG